HGHAGPGWRRATRRAQAKEQEDQTGGQPKEGPRRRSRRIRLEAGHKKGPGEGAGRSNWRPATRRAQAREQEDQTRGGPQEGLRRRSRKIRLEAGHKKGSGEGAGGSD
ncbi:hypothetical protein LSAT2_008023, partial [Lamellibrachia satsuma]